MCLSSTSYALHFGELIYWELWRYDSCLNKNKYNQIYIYIYLLHIQKLLCTTASPEVKLQSPNHRSLKQQAVNLRAGCFKTDASSFVCFGFHDALNLNKRNTTCTFHFQWLHRHSIAYALCFMLVQKCPVHAERRVYQRKGKSAHIVKVSH